MSYLGRPLRYDPTGPIPTARWVIESLLEADTVTLFSGDSGTGKSYLALSMMLAVVRGQSWCGFDTLTWLEGDKRHGKVMYIDNENSRTQVIKRLRMLGTGTDDWEHVEYYNRIGVQLGVGKWLNWTLEALDAFRPNLLVIDTVTSATAVASSDGDSVTRLFRDVLRPLTSPKRAVVILGHERKPSEGQQRDARNMAIGSIHWRTQADAMLSVQRRSSVLRGDHGRQRRFTVRMSMLKSRDGDEFSRDLRICSQHERLDSGKWRAVKAWVEPVPDHHDEQEDE